jgi:hypothetical protein
MASRRRGTKVFDTLVEFLEARPARAVGERVTAAEAAPLLELAKGTDPRVHAFLRALIDRHTSFCVFDVEAYPEQLLRGKRGEAWNADEAVVGPEDVCLARNGAGDIYVWNAQSGRVRFLLHDEGWSQKADYRDVDRFTEAVLDAVVEGIDADDLENADESYLACLALAVDIADPDCLDDEARAKLVELGVLAAD